MVLSSLQGADKIYSLGCAAPPRHARHILCKLHNQPERAAGEEKEEKMPRRLQKATTPFSVQGDCCLQNRHA